MVEVSGLGYNSTDIEDHYEDGGMRVGYDMELKL